MCQPSSLEEYKEWAKQTLSTDFNNRKIERLYETNLTNIYNAITQHKFFILFSTQASNWQEEYSQKTYSDLFMGSYDPRLVTKPYQSAIEKTYRVNILWNQDFPEEPKKGWVNHQNMFTQFNDLVRGILVCRFIDGPAFVAKKIIGYAKEHKLKYRKYTQERDDGYYAYHVYISFPAKIFDMDWNEEDVSVEVEIQIKTQLQEVLKDLTHKFYEKQRVSIDKDKSKWKWDFSSSRFKVGYLSHTLHLLESIILESREKVLGGHLKNNEDVEEDING
jgi:ppGpp synthetase/RelA/SpoT-type nucleotidyltranferase